MSIVYHTYFEDILCMAVKKGLCITTTECGAYLLNLKNKSKETPIFGAHSIDELYDFLERASSRELVQKIEFQEYVLNALGEIEDSGLPCMTWVFLHVRMYVRDILAEGEQVWPLPHFESEIREMARLQALAGWR